MLVILYIVSFIVCFALAFIIERWERGYVPGDMLLWMIGMSLVPVLNVAVILFLAWFGGDKYLRKSGFYDRKFFVKKANEKSR